MAVEAILRIGSTLKSPSSVNLRNPTALRTTSTATEARINPNAQATELIANTSIIIILDNVSSDPPITLWIATSFLRCSKDNTRP